MPVRGEKGTFATLLPEVFVVSLDTQGNAFKIKKNEQ
jgi:hypothetical protein